MSPTIQLNCPSPTLLTAHGFSTLLTPVALVEAIHSVAGAEKYEVRVKSIDDDEAEVLMNGEALTLHMFWHVDHWEWWTAATPDGKRWGLAREAVRWFSAGKPPPDEAFWHRRARGEQPM